MLARSFGTSPWGWVMALPLITAIVASSASGALAYNFERLYAVPSNEDEPRGGIANLPETGRVVLGTAQYVHIVIKYSGVSGSPQKVAVTCALYGPDGNKVEQLKTIRKTPLGPQVVRVPAQIRREIELTQAGEVSLAGFGPFDVDYKLDTYSIECVADRTKVRGQFRLDSMTIEELKAMGQRSVGLVGFHGPPETKVNGDSNDSCRSKPVGAAGTAFMIDSLGHMVTNHHVAAACRNDWPNARLYVEFKDGSRHDAEFVGADQLADVAVIRIASRSIPPLRWASEPPRDGEDAVAIGFPYSSALRGDVTTTRGIISGIARAVGHRADLVQTDAAINPGNSGGPLVNRFGQVVGVNTLGLGVGASSGVSFAVSAHTARIVAEQIIANRRVKRARLGVNETFDLMPLDVRAFSPAGLVVQSVADGSPATRATAGGLPTSKILGDAASRTAIRVCDVIDSISGGPGVPADKLLDQRAGDISRAIGSPGDLFNALLEFPPGTAVRIELRRPHPDDCIDKAFPVGDKAVRAKAVLSLQRATPMNLTVKLE